MARIVIIGDSVAGHSTAVNLRQRNASCGITVITEEPYFFYDRKRLADYLAGNIREKELFFCDNEFYSKNNIELLKGCKVVSVNPNKLTVSYKRDEARGTSEYDILVVCSGTKTQLPAINGILKEGVFKLDGLSDFKSIKQALVADTVCMLGWNEPAARIAKVITDRKKEVKVIVDKIILNPVVWEGIEQINTEVTDIIGESGIQAIKIKEGKIIGVSMVIVAGGRRPSVDFLKDSSVESCDDGIYVDEDMRTNINNIFSCGSVCIYRDSEPKAKNWDDTQKESMVVVDNIIKAIGG